jgi:5-methylcytosine-specific restriction protein A
MRSTPEWIGATDDAKIPARVRQRVFDAYGGICGESGRKIGPADKWDCDHKIALSNGGEHRESNLQPILREAHKAKTREDVKTKAKIASVRKKHLGIQKARKKIPYRLFDGTPVFPK